MTTEELAQRLSRIEAMLDTLLSQHLTKDYYSATEVAEILDRAEFTVREWCRLGRIHAEKRPSGRGPHGEWIVSHAELERIQCEGLLPTNETRHRL